MNKKANGKIKNDKNILSYCGKCKTNTDHTIFAMENTKVEKVICKTCGAKHNYRKPKDKNAIEVLKNTKSIAICKERNKLSKKWDDILANCDTNSVKDYSMKKNYKESSIINHLYFGIGVVTRRIGLKKIEVQFKEGVVKRLANNWAI